MKNSVKYLTILIAAALIFAMSLNVGAFGANGAGTPSDPVVTKSYVDAALADLRSQISASGASSFAVVVVEEGQKLIGTEGTEMVLRGGKATAIDNGIDGISDLTSGKDLKSPAAISKNHLLLVPRSDGRGIHCSTRAYVMVKGGYTIE